MEGPHMVPVAVTRDGFEARVIAARLGSEGIVWELRGSVDGPYPVGQVSVLVEEAELEKAREVLSGPGELDDELEADGSSGGSGGLWLALLVVVLVAGSALLRAVAVAG